MFPHPMWKYESAIGNMSVRACVRARARACACSCVTLLIQHATRMRHVYGLWLHLIFDIISETAIFGKKLPDIERVF